jgi:surfeit locus 1 family protein
MARPRLLLFLAIALAATLGFARLGWWQLDRLGERRAANAAVASRFDAPPVPLSEVLADTATARYRRTAVRGTWDYANELVLTSRSRQGSPGVHVITPLKPLDGSPAVLVNRGWVYAADGMTVDLAVWVEGDTGDVSGFVETYTNNAGPVATPSAVRGVRRLTADSVAARIPYPIAPVLVVQQDTAAAAGMSHPVRIEPPALGEGSHRSYAIQWFAFAAITIIGTLAVIRKERRNDRTSVE